MTWITPLLAATSVATMQDSLINTILGSNDQFEVVSSGEVGFG